MVLEIRLYDNYKSHMLAPSRFVSLSLMVDYICTSSVTCLKNSLTSFGFFPIIILILLMNDPANTTNKND